MAAQRTVPGPTGEDLLQFIIDGFLVRYPPNTRAGYGIAIRQWCQWCTVQSINVLDARRADIEVWARHLEEELHLRTSTAGSKLNAVCGMYRFAAIDGLLDHDPGSHVRRPKIEFVSTTNGLSRVQLLAMLNAAEAEGPTSHALICLLGLSGLGIGECLAADIEHLGFERGYRTLFLPQRKGGKAGRLALAVPTSWAIERAIEGRTSGPLLLGRNGERLQVAAARRTLLRLCRHIGVNKRITPNSLRRSFVTLALDAGVAERDIIDSTGLADSSMIRYYDSNRGGLERNATHRVAAFIAAAD